MDTMLRSDVRHEMLRIAGKKVETQARLEVRFPWDNRLVGSLNESHLYNALVRNSAIKSQPVESIMQPAFPFVDVSTPVDLLSTMITPESPAVLVRDFKTDKTFIITRSDLIRVL